jgi:hypothetical protein
MNLLAILVTSLFCLVAVASAQGPQTPSADGVLKTLRDDRPRLLLTDDRLAELRKLARTDPLLRKLVAHNTAQADKLLEAKVLKRVLKGPRLLGVSRDLVERVYTLGVAYRWTGKEKYAHALRRNLLAVCGFKDWNPSHFLDVAEMAHGVGVGYDWIYETLSDADRKTIREGLIKHGMRPGRRGLQLRNGKPRAWWARSEHNWNQVCLGGLSVGALAIASEDPSHARRIVPRAVEFMPNALKHYAPDGAWGEGVSYWAYATRYTAYGLGAMHTALGTDFGLSEIDGLAEAGTFPLAMTGPSGMYLNFADIGERSRLSDQPCLYWLARTYDKPMYAWGQSRLIADGKGKPQNIVWYTPAPKKKPTLKLDWRFGGPVEVATFRSAWDDPNALWLGVKAGYNQVNHGHLDLGNFEIEALGVRWARDLGKDDYNLPGYWDRKRGGTRWRYYRLNSLSHNVITLDANSQDPHATSTMTGFHSDKHRGLAVIAMKGLFPGRCETAKRGTLLDRASGRFVVQDEMQLKRACEVAWGMTTDAKIELNGDVAILHQDGHRLAARILSPDGLAFSTESAVQKKPQKSNRGVRRLMIRTKADKGPLRLVVEFVPLKGSQKKLPEAPPVRPLSKWTAEKVSD